MSNKRRFDVDCVPINRPSVVRLFSYQLGGKNNPIVILAFAVGAADLQNPQICGPAEEKTCWIKCKAPLRYWTLDFQKKELTRE